MSVPTILVIEDNAITLKLVRVTLASAGYRVLEAADGRTALALMAHHAPDLVLQESVLPDMDGFDLLARLRALPGGADLPILCLSGLLARPPAGASTPASFTDSLLKPVTPSDLLSAVQLHLRPPDVAPVAPPMGRHILVVDDNPLLRKLTRVHLELAGFRVTTATDGVQALALAEQVRPDAVVSDVLMPELDGFQLCLALRRHPSLAALPVVLLTTFYAEEADERLARAMGANALISRSPDLRDLVPSLLTSLAEGARWLPTVVDEPLTTMYARRVIWQLERQAMLADELRQRVARLETERSMLNGLPAILADPATVEAVLDNLLQQCLDTLGMSKGIVYLRGAADQLVARTHFGFPATAGTALADFFGHTQVLHAVLAGGEPRIVRAQTAGADWEQALLAQAAVSALLLLPLRAEEEELGILVLAMTDRELGEDWLGFLATVGTIMGRGIQLARALAKVSEHEMNLERVIATVPEGLMTVDRQGLLTHANAAAVQLLWLPETDEVVGEPLPTRLGLSLEQVLTRGEGVSGVEITLSHPGRAPLVLEVSATPLVDAEQAVVGAVVACNDITARKRAETAQRFLAAAGARLGASLDYQATLAVLAQVAVPTLADWCVVEMVEPDGTIQPRGVATWDEDWTTWLKAWVRSYPADPTATAGVARVIRTGEPLVLTEVTAEGLMAVAQTTEQLRQLRQIGFGAYMIVPMIAGGRTLGAISMARIGRERRYDGADVALAQELAHRAALAIGNAQLYQATQAAVAGRDLFLSIAAHELRTPMTSLSGSLQLLQHYQRTGRLDDAQLTRLLPAIDRGMTRLQRLITELLDVSSMHAGQLQLRRRPVDMGRLVSSILRQYQDLHGQQHPLTLTRHGATRLIQADQRFVERVLSNLLDNAIKYSPGGGPVRVVLDTRGEGQLLTVQDQGIGLPAGTAATIFEPFGRTANAERQQVPGLGLGLYIARTIVERHGGRVWAESPGEGKGTTMYVWLPGSEGDVHDGEEAV